MKFRVQLANRRTRTDDGFVYQLIGALVLDESGVISAVALRGGDGDQWVEERKLSFTHWSGNFLEYMTYLYDRNSTTTAYAKPVEIEADHPREAAEKAQIEAS